MIAENVFLRPRLGGPRFEGHAVPLEFLKDLAEIEGMVIEVAKWQYLQENRGRQRVPRRFGESIELALSAVESGSAVPVIVFAPLLTNADSRRFAEKARDLIIHAIDSMEKGCYKEGTLPEKILGFFDRIGRSLREGEFIEFIKPGAATGARLSREVRHDLLKFCGVREFTEEVSVRGRIPEVDQDAQTFHIQLADGRKLRAPLPIEHADAVMTIFNAYREGGLALLHGVGRFSRQNMLLSFDSVQRFSNLDPLDVGARVGELRLLRDGWLDDEGLAPDKAGLSWFESAFDKSFPDDLPLPYVYPTLEGNIQTEWSFDGWEIELEIDLRALKGNFRACRGEGDEGEEPFTIDFSGADGWEYLAKELRRFSGGMQ